MEDFKSYGHWFVGENGIDFKLYSDDVSSGLYAFLVNDDPMYIGKFENGLRSRLVVIRKPPESQETHQRLAPGILKSLLNNDIVRILVKELPKEKLLEARAIYRQNFLLPWAKL